MDKEMNIKIQNASPKEGGGDNKGSCRPLATYLEHEDPERIAQGKEPMPFLTPDGVEVTKEEVIEKIDRNHSHLGKHDDKFFSIIVAPSPDEIKAMGETEKEQYESGIMLMEAISNSYAENFNREEVRSASDLIIYWKFHFTRDGDGDLQFHMHGIVSRKSKGIGGKSLKISPMTSHKATEYGPVKGGFDRNAFVEKGEKIFDKLFHYDRKVAETFAYCNAQAHGTPEQKAEQAKLLAAESKEALAEKISAGIESRRNTIKVRKEAEELAAMLEQDSVALPKSSTKSLADAVDLADFRNAIIRIFAISADRKALELNLAVAGASCYAVRSQDGVEDIVFIKKGRKIPAKDILDPPQLRAVLNSWAKHTGEAPAFKVRAARAAADEEAIARKVAKKPAQFVPKMKIGR